MTPVNPSLNRSAKEPSPAELSVSSKIQPGHPDRLAVVYVRQSTIQQVAENRESTDRQYALVNRAIELGWSPDRILVIDEDQGKSGLRPTTGSASSGCWRKSVWTTSD